MTTKNDDPHLPPSLIYVIKYLILGYTHDQIGVKLNITSNTVKTHVAKIFDKYGVTEATSVVREALTTSFNYDRKTFKVFYKGVEIDETLRKS